MSFSKEIKTIRHQCLMTQNDFAAALNVSFSTVNRWETGKAKPNISTMKKVKEFCEKNAINFKAAEEAWFVSNVD